MTTQLITPNPNIACTPGMCLQYVREAFGVGITQPSAIADWNASSTQHPDQNFPDAWVPVFFTLEGIPEGHVALRSPDGSVYSSSDNTNIPHHHPSLDDLLNYYAYYGKPLTYLGWTEDIEGVPVVALIATDSISTPTQEDFLATLTDDEKTRLLAAADRINGVITDPAAKVLTTNDLPAIGKAVVNCEVPWYGFNGKIPATGRQTTNLTAQLGWMDTATNSLAAATKAAATSSAPALDVVALAAELAPHLNASNVEAFITAVRTQWNK